jgi:hypothetical protein
VSLGRCDYAEMEWYCDQPVGHDGRHSMTLFAEPLELTRDQKRERVMAFSTDQGAAVLGVADQWAPRLPDTLLEIAAERHKQEALHKARSFVKTGSRYTALAALMEEVGELSRAFLLLDFGDLSADDREHVLANARYEAVQVAAVGAAIREMLPGPLDDLPHE